MAARVELPDNLPACHALIQWQADRIETLEGEVTRLTGEVTRLEGEVSELKRDVRSLRRALFGSRRERFAANAPQEAPPSDDESSWANSLLPLELAPGAAQLDEACPASSTSPPPTPLPAPVPRASQGRRARKLPAGIARERILHRLREAEVSPELWNDPRARRFFRLVREEVEIQRPTLKIFEHYQEVLTVDCRAAETSRLVTAATPAPILERCYAGAGLLAMLAASRFADHIPYYREEDILARQQFLIRRATQWRWMRGLATFAWPLVDRMRERARQSAVMGIDETPIAQLCPERAATRQAYLYALHGDADHPYVCFEYASHKNHENVRRIVGNYAGYLQSDAYICYELVAAARSNAITPVGCWAHARRKFEPLVQEGPHPQATWLLERVQQLYDIEDRARLFSDAERWTLRQAESRPIVDEIARWLAERDQQELPRSPLRQGVNYLYSRWESFTRFLEEGAIPLDNNRTEADIKGPVMGKKAWLFFGNESGGETAAALYTLTMSCKRHSIDVVAYLEDIFRRLAAGKASAQRDPAELDELLPDRWIEAHPAARVVERVQESHAAAARKRQRRQQRRQKLLSG